MHSDIVKLFLACLFNDKSMIKFMLSIDTYYDFILFYNNNIYDDPCKHKIRVNIELSVESLLIFICNNAKSRESVLDKLSRCADIGCIKKLISTVNSYDYEPEPQKYNIQSGTIDRCCNGITQNGYGCRRTMYTSQKSDGYYYCYSHW
jgi:hypothetical protein